MDFDTWKWDVTMNKQTKRKTDTRNKRVALEPGSGCKLFKDFKNTVNESLKFLENTFIRSFMTFEEAAG